MLKEVVLSRHNMTTVPEEVRKLLDLHEGEGMAWMLEGSRIIVEKVRRSREVNT